VQFQPLNNLIPWAEQLLPELQPPGLLSHAGKWEVVAVQTGTSGPSPFVCSMFDSYAVNSPLLVSLFRLGAP